MRKLTTEEFVNRAKEIHNDRYIYTKTVYENAKQAVTVTCRDHGDYQVVPQKHLAGANCPQCTKEHSQDYKRDTTESFIEKAIKVHKDKYTYEKVVYGKSNEDKVIITCNEHGDFTQSPGKHLSGRGCPLCKNKTISNLRRVSPNGWSYSVWEEKAKVSNNFEAFSLYVIECSSTTTKERFLKVGKTFTTIAKRFGNSEAMPYKFKVITQVFHNAYAISKLEDKIKKAFKDHKYLPTKSFDGQYECFTIEQKDLVVEMAEA